MYRLAPNSPIIETSFDYVNSTIGPYKVPIKVQPDIQLQQKGSVSPYQYYDMLYKNQDMLAIINVNNYCFLCLYADSIAFTPLSINDIALQNKLPYYPDRYNIQTETYQHIGYIRTEQVCKAAHLLPYHLLRNERTGYVPYVTEQHINNPLINPPLNLYKELLKTEHKAVYYDMDSRCCVFID